MRRLLPLLVLLWLPLMPLRAAGYPYLPADSLIRQGIAQMYNYDLEEAQRTFRRVINRYPAHPAGYYLSGVSCWMQQRGLQGIPSSEDTLLARMRQAADIAERYTEAHPEDPYGFLLYGMAQGTRARVDLAGESWLDAVIHGYQGIRLVQRARVLEPDLPDLRMAFGAFHYYVGMSGWLTKAAASLVGLSGTTTQGKAELRYAARHSRYATPEAHAILLFVNGYLEDSVNVALEHAEYLNRRYPDNPYYRSLRGDLEFAAGDTAAVHEAMNALGRILPALGPYDQKQYRSKITYLHGLLAYNRGDYTEAITLLQRYLDDGIEEYDFLALNAQLFLGKCYQKQEEPRKARRYFARVAEEKIPGRIRAQARRMMNDSPRRIDF